MRTSAQHDAWSSGSSYDRYMGRWSRKLAPRFLDWLDVTPDLDWLEVGCGTGSLTSAILEACSPRSVTAIDTSEDLIARARSTVSEDRVTFVIADAQALPLDDASASIAVSGLVLNFVPDRHRMLSEMIRSTARDGTVAFYVWDYPGGGLQFVRAFWTAAIALDPSAADFVESRRFPFCTREALADFASAAGLQAVETTALDVPTVFSSFEDFWQPFTLGTGPAPGYHSSLTAEQRERLKKTLEASLPRASGGSIALTARAWAVKGRKA